MVRAPLGAVRMQPRLGGAAPLRPLRPPRARRRPPHGARRMSDLGVTLPSSTAWSSATTWLPERPPWMAEAACLGADPDLFFADTTTAAAAAKAVCATCPVRADCLDYAVAGNERFGVWGGASVKDRRRIRRRVGRADEIIESRRRQVRAMADVGMRGTEIAAELGLSRRTVTRYLQDAS